MIRLWHGGGIWHDKPEVRAQKKGNQECGPGIYMSTNYSTARNYGRSLTLVTLTDQITWLEDTKLPSAVVFDYLDKLSGKGVPAVLADVKAYQARLKHENGEPIPASVLVNLLLFHGAAHGERGVQLAAWLVKQGIDASRYNRSINDDWVIVFNPKVIAKYERATNMKITSDMFEFPTLKALKEAKIESNV